MFHDNWQKFAIISRGFSRLFKKTKGKRQTEQWDQGKARAAYQQCPEARCPGAIISRERGQHLREIMTNCRNFIVGPRTITNRLLAARPNGIEINDLIMPADVIIYMNAL